MKTIKGFTLCRLCLAILVFTMVLSGCAKKVMVESGALTPPSMDYDKAMADDERRAVAEEAPAKESRASASGLKAGFSDDNRQYGYFLDFLQQYKHVPHQALDVGERIIFSVKDGDGKPIPNVHVKIRDRNKTIDQGKTWADGSFLFFPSMHGPDITSYDVTLDHQGMTKKITLDRYGKRQVKVALAHSRQLPSPIPLDIVFILDTTGSMGEEIKRLKQTIELINLNLSSVTPAPAIRFGMVLYKDRSDSYDTKVIPFTSDLKTFQTELYKVTAGGGGDTPEDLEAALDKALNTLSWNDSGIRLGFIITDAPPKYYDNQPFTYSRAAMAAKEKGIKLFSVGTGGLPLAGEYVLRQISQFTSAAYIFLTYGEKGESEGGKAGSVSHHTGSNFQTDKLEAIIIRFARDELSHLSDTPVTSPDEYYKAVALPGEAKEETLKNLFEKAVTQLSDYSSIEIPEATPTAVLPLVSGKENALNCEYFTEHMIFALSSSPLFKHVARDSDMQSAEDELALGLSGMVDESNALEVGNFIGAQMLITGKLYREKDRFILFFKLIRVETAEVLSVTKLVVDKQLGLDN